MKLFLWKSVAFLVCSETFNFIEMEISFPEAEVRKRKGWMERLDQDE